MFKGNHIDYSKIQLLLHCDYINKSSQFKNVKSTLIGGTRIVLRPSKTFPKIYIHSNTDTGLQNYGTIP